MGHGHSHTGLGSAEYPSQIPGEDRARVDESLAFSLVGKDMYFGPAYVPERIQLNKERNLVRHANFCGLEDVFEIHGHNREIHVSGWLRQDELSAFERVLDHNQVADLITPGWSGRVRVVKGEHEGPEAWDPRANQWLWKYSLDLVSTGEDEARHIAWYQDGIIDDGTGSLEGTTDPRSGATLVR